MKYKVGDKVRIREDLVMGENYGGSVAVDDMTDMCGSVVTIERVGNFRLLHQRRSGRILLDRRNV